MTPWFTHDGRYANSARPFHYVEQAFNPATGYHIHAKTVYCLSRRDFESLIGWWSHLGTRPNLNSIEYRYHAAGAA